MKSLDPGSRFKPGTSFAGVIPDRGPGQAENPGSRIPGFHLTGSVRVDEEGKLENRGK